MSNVALVFERTLVQIGAVVLDVSLAEAHSMTNEVTDHPVESGVNIVDHVRPRPDVLKLEGLVSNHPFPTSADPLVIRQEQGQQFISRSATDLTRARTAFEDLRALREAGTLLTVVTGLRTYESMAIESLEVPRDARTGQTLRFTCTLKQVRLAVVQTAAVVQSTRIDKGKKATKTTPPEQDGTVFNGLNDLSGERITGGIRGAMDIFR